MRCVSLIAWAALICAAAPTTAQYIYVDTNGDGICVAPMDVITDLTTSVDLWLDTDSRGDGTSAQCIDGQGTPLSMLSYEFILKCTDGLTFGTFTNAIASFTTPLGAQTDGSYYHNGYGGGSVIEVPGLHKLGTLETTVSPGHTPRLGPVAAAPGHASWSTGSGSECAGLAADFKIRLGTDFTDACGFDPLATRSTTWGVIKRIYSE